MTMSTDTLPKYNILKYIRHFLALVVAPSICVFIIVYKKAPISHLITGPLFIISGVIFFFYATDALLYQWNKISSRSYREEARQTTAKAEALQEDLSSDFFNNLVRINFKYIDRYYLQTQEQASRSFVVCVTSGVCGLIIVCIGIWLMYMNLAGAGSIAAATGALTEFISAVFFYLYNRTIISMSGYHQKLVITQNISLALKITNELEPIERSKAQLALVDALTKDVNQLLASPTPEASPARVRRNRAG